MVMVTAIAMILFNTRCRREPLIAGAATKGKVGKPPISPTRSVGPRTGSESHSTTSEAKHATQ
eukprot:1178969-Prorocentrum_lima.AAC.1